MATWYYYNESGDKIEVTGGQLKGLAKAGMITPDTTVETEEGKTVPARKIKGLTFAETVPNETSPYNGTYETVVPDAITETKSVPAQNPEQQLTNTNDSPIKAVQKSILDRLANGIQKVADSHKKRQATLKPQAPIDAYGWLNSAAGLCAVVCVFSVLAGLLCFFPATDYAINFSQDKTDGGFFGTLVMFALLASMIFPFVVFFAFFFAIGAICRGIAHVCKTVPHDSGVEARESD